MRNKEYVAGLDVGTAGVKALAFSYSGKMLGSAKRSYKVIEAENQHMEHDPRIVYHESVSCLNELIRMMEGPPGVIGICTFMHSLMAVDKSMNPLCNLMLWNDNRSSVVARQLRETEQGNRFYMTSGTPVHPMSPLTKIRWLKENNPQVFENTAFFIGIKEYLLFMFTGMLVVDYSTASATGLFDSHAKRWNSDALSWCGVKKSQLPELVTPMEGFRTLPRDLKNDILIIPGISDGCAANLGTACIAPDDLALTLGTSGAVRFTGNEKMIDKEGILFSYCLDDQLYVNGGASNNCYNVIDRFSDELGIKVWELDENWMAGKGAAAEGLYFLPWMFGERAPFQLYRAHSSFIDLKASHHSLQRLKSVIECILFNLKQIADKLKELKKGTFEHLHISGGMTGIPGMKALASNIFGLPVLEHESTESSALGAAFYAARQSGIVRHYGDVRLWNPVTSIHDPDPEVSAQYKKLFENYLSMAGNYVKRIDSSHRFPL